jgi:hypothetical protein
MANAGENSASAARHTNSAQDVLLVKQVRRDMTMSVTVARTPSLPLGCVSEVEDGQHRQLLVTKCTDGIN